MKIDGTTRVIGIMGDPVAHSLSPLMQNAAIEAAGINAVYVPFHVQASAVEPAVMAVRALRLTGVNVTVPHKQAIMPYLDEIDKPARLVGAVNTIVNRSGRLVGYNTDGQGFVRSLRHDFGFLAAGKKIVLLGAGGAARAAAVSLADAGATEVVIANRTVAGAEGLVVEFSTHFPGVRFTSLPLEEDRLKQELNDSALLVNTTSLGLHGEDLPFSVMPSLPKEALFYDMVYAAEPTPLQKAARTHGITWADGRGMLVGQGEAAFRLWFDTPAPAGVMQQKVAK